MRFKEFLNEATLAVADVKKEPGKKKVTVVVGRFQPNTLGHEKLFAKAKGKLVIAVVNTDKKTEKSPLPFSLQKKLLQKAAPGAEIIQIKTGFIGEFIDPLRKKGLEPSVLFAGADRENTYKSQVERYKEQLNLSIKVQVIKRTGKDISATQVREAIKKDDKKTFEKLTDKAIHGFYDEIKKYIK